MKANKIITVIVSIFLWLIILVAALFAFTTLATRDANNVSNLFGFTPMTVQSESMSPTFSAGDLIVIKTCDTDDLEVGDIISFHTIIENQYAINTHRIYEIEELEGVRAFRTKGDNNAIADESYVGSGDIVGKYLFHIKGFGNFIDFLSGPVGFFVVLVLPMLAFFIYQVYHLIMVSIKLKKAMAVEAAEEAAKAAAGITEAANAPAANAETENKLSEAEAALAEAKRVQAELEAKLAALEQKKTEE